MRFDPQSNFVDHGDDQPGSSSGRSPTGSRAWGGYTLVAVVLLGLITMVGWLAWPTGRPGSPRTAVASTDVVIAPVVVSAVDDDPEAEAMTPEPASVPTAATAVPQLNSTDRDAAMASYRRGRSLIAVGKHRAALPHLEYAIELNPDAPQPHYSLGLAFHALGERDAAREQCELLKDLDPSLASLLGNLTR